MRRFVSDTIRIIGLQFNVRHGVRPEEKTLTQPFEVDVEISRDLTDASHSDKLKDTLDYSQVVALVRDVMHGPQCRLLERLAGKIFDSLSTIIDNGDVTIRVRKPRAPIDVPFETVEVELKRSFRRD